jgi:hypothetical protein
MREVLGELRRRGRSRPSGRDIGRSILTFWLVPIRWRVVRIDVPGNLTGLCP